SQDRTLHDLFLGPKAWDFSFCYEPAPSHTDMELVFLFPCVTFLNSLPAHSVSSFLPFSVK
ncbi:hypothetical protein, partial [uncultured Treponema sp.]|uniref:hypothetical protein n=1 Tax=uncultured Treponema sp. TaxID=162155 RepID=UPI0027D9CC0C